MSEQCTIPEDCLKDSFDEVLEAMQTDKYWINFFVRPCCPAPGAEQAKKMLEKRRGEVRDHASYSDAEKDQLLELIDQREEWYLRSPFCKK